jgi:CheY-like chemotaxis protein
MQRILLIEDDRSVRTIIALQLRILGYQVEVAEDGEMGIELFTRAGNFDLVMCARRSLEGGETSSRK